MFGMPVMLRLVRSNDEPPAPGGALGGGPVGPIITKDEAARLLAEAKEAAAKGPVRYTSPYDFILSPGSGMTAIAPPWSHLTAYDLNTGDIKWQVPNGDDPATVDHFGKGDGPRDTGGVGARNGMVVTKSPLTTTAAV